HPDPPSFPTRRSSDLEHELQAVEGAWAAVGEAADVAGHAADGVQVVARSGRGGGGGEVDGAGEAGVVGDAGGRPQGGRAGVGERSEEHTSELQSRENL